MNLRSSCCYAWPVRLLAVLTFRPLRTAHATLPSMRPSARFPPDTKLTAANETERLSGGFHNLLIVNSTIDRPEIYAVRLGHGQADVKKDYKGLADKYGQKVAVEQLKKDLLWEVAAPLINSIAAMLIGRAIVGLATVWRNAFRKVSKVRFSDVIGCDFAKDEIETLLQYLKEPKRYQVLGAKIPKGVLLVGPPGVGKTLIAKALAGEADVPFLYVSGSEFSMPFVGMGVQKIRGLFRQARRSKRAIVYIDEFDAIARTRRTSGLGGAAEHDSENTLNELLTEMDGFRTLEGGSVIVLASTNRPEVLDKAALRPGRFDRKIYLTAPDVAGREEHFTKLLSQLKLEQSVQDTASLLARMTPGCVGADIANICNEAALRAAKLNRTSILEEDLSWAVEREGMGVRNTRAIPPEELRRTAVHEAGHVLNAYLLPDMQRPIKVSVLPRGDIGGYAQLGDRNFTHQSEGLSDCTARSVSLYTLTSPPAPWFFAAKLRAEIAVLLSGRAAEEVVYRSPSTGASNDLREATALTRQLLEKWGYSKRTGLMTLGHQLSMYDRPEMISQATLQLLEEETQEILAEEYKRAKATIVKHRDKLNGLVERLVEKEVLHETEIVQIMNSTSAKPCAA